MFYSTNQSYHWKLNQSEVAISGRLANQIVRIEPFRRGVTCNTSASEQYIRWQNHHWHSVFFDSPWPCSPARDAAKNLQRRETWPGIRRPTWRIQRCLGRPIPAWFEGDEDTSSGRVHPCNLFPEIRGQHQWCQTNLLLYCSKKFYTFNPGRTGFSAKRPGFLLPQLRGKFSTFCLSLLRFMFLFVSDIYQG